MGISQLVLMRPLPGRLDDFIDGLKTSKAVYEKSGATVHCFRTVAGGEAGGVLFSSTVDNWDDWAKAAKAAESNKDYTNLVRESANNPAAEIVSTAILEEFELPA